MEGHTDESMTSTSPEGPRLMQHYEHPTSIQEIYTRLQYHYTQIQIHQQQYSLLRNALLFASPEAAMQHGGSYLGYSSVPYSAPHFMAGSVPQANVHNFSNVVASGTPVQLSTAALSGRGHLSNMENTKTERETSPLDTSYPRPST